MGTGDRLQRRYRKVESYSASEIVICGHIKPQPFYTSQLSEYDDEHLFS
jgi:hypothetical protein